MVIADSEVVGKSGMIPGLYAAGEIAEGIHFELNAEQTGDAAGVAPNEIS